MSEWAKTLLITEPAPAEQTEADDEEPEEVEAQAEAEPEQDEPEEEPEVAEEPRFKVKIDGEEVEVTLEELKRGYSGQGKIQKGLQEAAEKRKQAEQALQALQAEQQRVLQVAQALQSQGLVQPPKMPDPKLAETDPIKFLKEQARYQADAQAYQQQQAQIAAIQAQHQRASEAAMRAQLAEQQARLNQLIPDFANPEKAAQVRSKLIETGSKAYGYSEQELMGVTDARAVQVLHDAMKWRELQARTAEAKKSPDAPRTVKPAAKRPEPPQLAAAKLTEKAKKTQSIDDWARSLLIPKT